MAVHAMHGQMDYNLDSKQGKMLEDRLDSGVDSLKDETLMIEDFKDLTVRCKEETTEEWEPWRDAVTEDGDTLLHLAIIHEAIEHVLQMIQLSRNHSFLNKQNHQRQTALHLAVITEQPKLVDCLLKAGADPLLADNSGNTALHIACKRGSMACFGVITQNCQRHLTSEPCSGRTALHLAVDLQNPTLVRCLLDLGAEVNCQNYGGFTPYHLTYGRQNDEIRCQLYERTALELRALPESESDDSDMEDLELLEDENYGNNFYANP
uniref:NF-kappa-B inhibitor alpha n=1 Tax=Poecilia mexicana TaxID=48701 RepID=A0A3B3YA86_9TELE